MKVEITETTLMLEAQSDMDGMLIGQIRQLFIEANRDEEYVKACGRICYSPQNRDDGEGDGMVDIHIGLHCEKAAPKSAKAGGRP